MMTRSQRVSTATDALYFFWALAVAVSPQANDLARAIAQRVIVNSVDALLARLL